MGPTGVQPNSWLTPGVETIPANSTKDPAAVASTIGARESTMV
nr:hypothetical protein CPGR_02384 [Mycolicibacter nonchromogenicus]